MTTTWCVTQPLSALAAAADVSLQRYAELIAADPEIAIEDPMPQECLAAFNSLWADKGVQLAILKGNQYALHDNLS